MKFYSIALLTLTVACSQAPEYSSQERSQMASMQSPSNTEAVEASASVSIDESKADELIKAAEARIETSREPTVSPTPAVSVPTTTVSPQKPDFMSSTEAGVKQAFASAVGKNGKQLSAEQAEFLGASFMQVINAAQSKNPLKVSQAFNGFMKDVKQVNLNAKAANGGLIADLADLALDILDLAVDLITAVLMLDVAGVIDVAVDLIELLIDFLV